MIPQRPLPTGSTAVLLLLACWLTALLGLSGAELTAPPPTSPPTTNEISRAELFPAKYKISGFGLLGNLELKKAVRLLQPKDQPKPVLLDANFIEDGARIILSTLENKGYLAPTLFVTVHLTNNTVREFRWQATDELLLPRPLPTARVEFKVDRGVRYYYQKLTFEGLHSLEESVAKKFFVETDILIPTRKTRIYTPSRLKRSAAGLQETLTRQAFAHATVLATNLTTDPASGAVRVHILVNEGLPGMVRSVRTEIQRSEEDGFQPEKTQHPGVPYSPIYVQDLAHSLRTNQFVTGHPDATVSITTTNVETTTTNLQFDLLARVVPGPYMELGRVRLEGTQKTDAEFLARRLTLDPGQPLNPIQVERNRYRLARLGIFHSVQVRYDQATPSTRDAVFLLEEAETVDLSLLFGYGSYELLRGGVELNLNNVFGRAHRIRFRGVQSFKSTFLDLLYSVPEIGPQEIGLFFNASGLRREEVSFEREEYLTSLGAQRYFRAIESEVSLRYTYQFLNAANATLDLPNDVRQANVSSFILDVKHDQRDNLLLPRSGYKIFNSLELASSGLGGEADYFRLELAASYHHRLWRAFFLHLGLAHGAVLTYQNSSLPYNKRFFPGGESSVRGYQQGEASPLDADGEPLGAETYLQGNLELEQVLTPNWSLVGFLDAVGFAEDIGRYPMNEALYSAGGGVSWKTLIGPVRLEYGHNLNRRRHDPAGTVHFSLGFPF